MADSAIPLALAITLLPLAGFVALVFLGQWLPRKGDWLATGIMGVCLILSLLLFGSAAGGGLATPKYDPAVYTFMQFGGNPAKNVPATTIGFSVLVDNMTAVMLVVVTVVSFLVHLFSIGYMHGDPKYRRFFAFLQLFTFSMLGHCIAGNLLLAFVFWELIGVCSYFLIGHFYDKNYDDPNQITPRQACVKAFITTRVGDLGFFLGIMMILAAVGSLEFPDIFRSAIDAPTKAATWDAMGGGAAWGTWLLFAAGIAFFFGPVGKSAQFPLHTWLPDAMEGPTPVSALIHAATMVAAGVYMVARMFPFLAGPGYLSGDVFGSPALLVVMIVGGFTAIFAATIAVAQWDIKKVLAYSTVSQLGFMMLGIGAGSVAYGMYHLFTHAMFKACLFLGSGSVIHGCHHEQDMRKMGGLKSRMPITFYTMLIATLAIAGFPFLSGWVSKDGILVHAFATGLYGDAGHGGGFRFWAIVPWILATIAAVLTAFYMMRMVFHTFWGEPKSHHAEEAHESPWVMWVPLAVLATLAIVAGGLAIGGKWFPNLVNDQTTGVAVANLVTGESRTFGEQAVTLQYGALTHDAAQKVGEITTNYGHWHHAETTAHAIVPWLSTILALAAMGFAYVVFVTWKERDLVAKLGLGGYRRVLEKLYYVDILYGKLFVGGAMALRLILKAVDIFIVDGLVNLAGWIGRGVSWIAGQADFHGVDGAVRGTGESVLGAGADVRRVQSGKIGDYVWSTVFSLAVIVVAAVMIGLGAR